MKAEHQKKIMKKNKKKRALFCAAIAMILSFGTAQAQNAQNTGAAAGPLSLSIQDAVDLALKNK